MKHLIIILYGLISAMINLHAQVLPSWTVDENKYEFKMTFVGKVFLDGIRLNSSSDIVGAFVDGECRGVAKLIYNSTFDAYFVYLTVYGNTSGEKIIFKVYSSKSKEEITIGKITEFKTNDHLGSLFQSFVFAKPPLRSEADLISFEFLNQKIDSLGINNDKINLYFKENIDLSNLTPSFTLSPGAKAFINKVNQISGFGIKDFSNPVVYQINC